MWQAHSRQPFLRSVVSMVRPRRPMDGTAAGSARVMGRRHPVSNTGSYRSRWKPPSQLFIDTTSIKFFSSTSLPSKRNDTDDGGASLMEQIDKKQSLTEFDASYRFHVNSLERSDTESSSGDDRARAKLVALSDAKKAAMDAQAAYVEYSSTGVGEVKELYERWILSQQLLSLAYSQAIKYTSRIHHDEEATKTAERLMYEWMDSILESYGSSLVWMKDIEDSVEDSITNYLNKKWMVRTIHNIVPRLTKSSVESAPDDDKMIFPKIRLPPPSSKDYINLLRAYSNSKARRKGQQCEALMKSMMMLANIVSCHYDTNNENPTEERTSDIGRARVVGVDGKETEQWKIWVNESIPNSKVFALAIKCHAGTTRPESLERIILLNNIHDAFTDCCRPHISGMYKDDPYVLLHSIKALKNLQKKEERDLGQEWLGKLHTFVTSLENKDYYQGYERADDDGVVNGTPNELDQSGGGNPSTSFSQTIDVTSAYTTMIRLIARLRGTKGMAADACDVLNRMHRVHDVFQNGLEPIFARTDSSNHGDVGYPPKRIASIHIRSNVYNLVLSLYKDSKNAEDATKAVELLQRMVDAEKQESEDRGGVPLPTEQSFEYTIMSLANMSNADRAFSEAERLISLMQEQKHLESSVAAYNAFITVCNKQLFGKIRLYDKALEILDTMNQLGKSNADVRPNPETLALVMKACSLSDHTNHQQVLDTASNLFSQLKEMEPSEKSSVALTDRAYYYMMNCVENHMIGDADAKKERIQELFSEACQRGLCSANVLSQFRNSVSEEDYRLTVGNGRLADHWIANITGPRALYTDGSKGGAGKNARRKGKSTSDWTKKAKAKESERVARKNDRKTKKKKLNAA